MTLIEAAELLGTSPDNLRGAIARGSLKAEKIGRDWHVSAKAVETYRTQKSRPRRQPRAVGEL
jgi:excisionase family DNA binding protein